MVRYALYVAVCGILLLMIATAVLVLNNWNDDSKAKVWSAVFIGTATAFVTVWFSLKETSFSSRFSTTIVFSPSDGNRPPMLIHSDPDNTLTQRTQSLSRLSNPIRRKGDPKPAIVGYTYDSECPVAPPKAEELTAFYTRLIQYAMFRDVCMLQRPMEGMSISNQSRGAPIFAPAIYAPFQLSDRKGISGALLLDAVKANPFSVDSLDQDMWKQRGREYDFPPGVVFKVPEIGERRSASQPILSVEKAGFFVFEVFASPMIFSNAAAIPAGINPSWPEATQLHSIAFHIELRVKFERLTSGNSRTPEYQSWLRHVSMNLERKWSDANNQLPPPPFPP